MGISMCNSELDPANYPPVLRMFRSPTDKTSGDEAEKFQSQGRASRTKTEVHVMSYNVLADCLCGAERHPFQSSRVLDFSFRSPRIIDEIEQSEASILCLQELDHISDLYDEALSKMGFTVVYGSRDTAHTIAIAFKRDEWFLIDQEQVDLGAVQKWFPEEASLGQASNKQALLCMLQHQQSRRTLVIGNCHLEHRPELDHLKFAQACLLMERSAKYLRENRDASSDLPFVCGGDFNSLPVSSVLSAFYNERIDMSPNEGSPSTWNPPSQDQAQIYFKIQKMMLRKIESGLLDPLASKLRSAYDKYRLPEGKSESAKGLMRGDTMPEFTHYKAMFQGTLDHLLYSTDTMEVERLLEIPERSQVQSAIPSTIFPSDHVRIEAIFTLI